MSKHKEKKISIWTALIKLLPQVASISPLLFTINYVFFAFDGILDGVTVFCMQLLFDRVTDLVTNKGTFKNAVLALFLLFLIKILKEVTSGIANFIGEAYDMKTGGKLSHIVNLKMARLDPICFENPEILDDINKSYLGIKYARTLINTIMDIITSYSPYFIFMGIYLFKLKPILLISLLLVFLPVLFNQLIRVKVYSKLEDNSAPLRRKIDYYEDCLVGREYAKETRILGACPYFIKLFKETLSEMNKIKWRADVKTNLIEFSMKMLSLAGYLGILWLLFDSLMKRDITVGAFAAVFTSVDNMFNLMEEVICGRLPYCAENFGKVQNLLNFLYIEERAINEDSAEKTFHGDIILKDVSFSYPFSNKNAVEDINLYVKKGETIAIVGENGSGKSTLIRLITGLYLPTKGEVFHNKKNTRNFSSKSLFNNISGVFQKFQKYQLTLSDNITISEMNSEIIKQENITKAIFQAGIELDSDIFPNHLNTMLCREFDGVDLSGGQWQKVAIARGFYRDHELIVLDEPTAAIDPVEETKVYESFAEIAKNKTAIIVTHRLGSVKFADRIVVMKGGKILDIGSHESLILRCPFYATMWKAQAQYYKTSDKII